VQDVFRDFLFTGDGGKTDEDGSRELEAGEQATGSESPWLEIHAPQKGYCDTHLRLHLPKSVLKILQNWSVYADKFNYVWIGLEWSCVVYFVKTLK